jgi:signal transduction histidine kinase
MKHLYGLKFRETNIIKIIEDSLSKLPCHDGISIELKALLDDESVLIDHDQMAAVLMYLEQNALEAMPDGGTLTISVTGDERRVTILLTDTGKGIAEENMPLLFTPFFTTKPVGDGSGLGLPSAYAAVKAHRGDIAIESNADPHKGPTGATVRITLPRRQGFQDKQARVILHDDEE